MEKIQTTTSPDEYDSDQLVLTRSVLLEHLFASQATPEDVLKHARRYTAVTHWEELLCAVINPDAAQLTAIITIRQADGYSGIFRRHGSIEYVRFFLDWGDGEGYHPISLTHFKVCDLPQGHDSNRLPRYWLVSTKFDDERYWGAVLKGLQPKVKAVLSWNQVPALDHAFTPVFGNAVESRIRVDSEGHVMDLFRQKKYEMEGRPEWLGIPRQEASYTRH